MPIKETSNNDHLLLQIIMKEDLLLLEVAKKVRDSLLQLAVVFHQGLPLNPYRLLRRDLPYPINQIKMMKMIRIMKVARQHLNKKILQTRMELMVTMMKLK